MERSTKVLLVIVIILLVSNVYLLYSHYLLLYRYQFVRAEYARIAKEYEVLKSQLEYYKSISTPQISNSTLAYTNSASITFHAVAVRSYYNEYKGVVLNFTIYLAPGNGMVLVNTKPKIGIELQSSLRTAKIVAERYTGINLSNYNIILSIYAESEFEVVDGPSAGAAITAALISLILGKELNLSVYLTGTILLNGSVGRVGGVLEKAIAAAEAGAKLFLVPRGCIYDYVLVWEEIFPGFYVGKLEKVNIKDYLREHGYNIEVKEVSNIDEVLKYLWSVAGINE